MNCEYCNRLAKNENSYKQHKVRCKLNPSRIVVIPSYGRLGKTHSEETKSKMSKSAIKQHADGRGSIPPSSKGTKHSESTKTKISNSMMGNRNANHRGDRQSYYGDVRMDSSWEVKTAKYLDKLGVSWKYSPQGFKLSDGRVYFPDFFVYTDNGELEYLIEVKGYFRENNRLKFEQFLSEYPQIVMKLWQKPELTKLGII